MAEAGAVVANVDPNPNGTEEVGFAVTPSTQYLQDAISAGRPWESIQVPVTERVYNSTTQTWDTVPVLDSDGNPTFVYERVGPPDQRMSCIKIWQSDFATFSKLNELPNVTPETSFTVSIEDSFIERDELNITFADNDGYYIFGDGAGAIREGQLLYVEQISGTDGAAVTIPQRYFVVSEAPEITTGDSVTVKVHAVEWCRDIWEQKGDLWNYTRASMMIHAEIMDEDATIHSAAMATFNDSGWYQTWVGIAWLHMYEAFNGHFTLEGELRDSLAYIHMQPVTVIDTIDFSSLGESAPAGGGFPGGIIPVNPDAQSLVVKRVVPAWEGYSKEVYTEPPTLLEAISRICRAVSPEDTAFSRVAPISGYITYRGDGVVVLNSSNRRMNDYGLVLSCDPAMGGIIRVPCIELQPKFERPKYQRVFVSGYAYQATTITYDTATMYNPAAEYQSYYDVLNAQSPPSGYTTQYPTYVPGTGPYEMASLAPTEPAQRCLAPEGLAEHEWQFAITARPVDDPLPLEPLPEITPQEVHAELADVTTYTYYIAPELTIIADRRLDERWCPYPGDQKARTLELSLADYMTNLPENPAEWESAQVRMAQFLASGVLGVYTSPAYTLQMKIDSAFPLTGLMQEVKISYTPQGMDYPLITGYFVITAITQPADETPAEWTLEWRRGL